MKRHGLVGFTLIELMIVVVIIAILAAVGYPSYQDHVRKAKRTEGKTALLKAAQVLERYYSDKGTYVTDLGPLFGLAAAATVYSGENPADDARSAYTITATNQPCGDLAACYTLTATPVTPTSARLGFKDDTRIWCGKFTLTSGGTRGFENTADPKADPYCKW